MNIKEIFFRSELRKKFTEVFKTNGFRGSVSISGGGSDLVQTKRLRIELPKLLNEFHVKTFMDAPCGDFYWMKQVDLSNLSEYIGIDIVKDIIKHNNKNFKSQKRKFICKDITKDKLPNVDLVLCRDCLNHLSFADSERVIKNFKKCGIKYMLVTTFTNTKNNTELNNQIWRPLNLEIPPFNFPKPTKIIVEECSENEGKYADKSLGLWEF